MRPEERNKATLDHGLKTLGSKMLINLDEKDIQSLSNSKSFDLNDYFKKIIVLNRAVAVDNTFEIEKKLTEEYKQLLEERQDIETNNPEYNRNKRYQNIKAQTDYGLPFFLMQGYFKPKTLNQISKQNPKIVYKLDNEIERRAKRSRYFKNDKERATINATINVLRDEFPKAEINGLSKATLTMDNSGMTISRIAAKTINSICSSGMLSGLVSKLSERIDSFTSLFKIKPTNKYLSGAKTIAKYAASAAAVAILGNEALEIISTPMPPIADLGIRETIEALASVDLSNVKEVANNQTMANDIMQVSSIDVQSLNINTNGVAEIADTVREVASISTEEQDIINFIVDKQDIINISKGTTLEELAMQHLNNSSTDEIQQFVSAVSEYNDINNPNVILTGEDIQIPSNEFISNFKPDVFEVTTSNKTEFFNQMKDVTIGYGETQSQLIEKLSSGLKDVGGYNEQQLVSFKEQLKDAIPVDLKAFDESVSDNIRNVAEKFENLTNRTKLKFN